MTYLFVTERPKVILIVSEEFIPGQLSSVSSAEAKFGGHSFNVYCEEETFVRLLVITRYSDCLSLWDIKSNFMRQVPQLWWEHVER